MNMNLGPVGPNITRKTTHEPVATAPPQFIPGGRVSTPARETFVRDEVIAHLPSGAAFKAAAAGKNWNPSQETAWVKEFQPPTWNPAAKATYNSATIDIQSGTVTLSRYPDKYNADGSPKVDRSSDYSDYSYRNYDRSYREDTRKVYTVEHSLTQDIEPNGATTLTYRRAATAYEEPLPDYQVRMDAAGNFTAYAKGERAPFTVDPKGNGIMIHGETGIEGLGWLVRPDVIAKPGSLKPLQTGQESGQPLFLENQ